MQKEDVMTMTTLDEIAARVSELRADGAKAAMWRTDEVLSMVAALKAVEARCDESEKASIRSFARTFDGSLFDAMLSTREIRAAIREALGS